MTRTTVTVIAVAGTLATSAALDAVNAQQQLACLHATGETQADATRRQDALRVMRTINTVQAQVFARNQTYQNLRELSDSGLPPRPYGFVMQLTVEGSTYALLLRDTVDPCRYTLFSSQDGLIFVGSPLQ